MISRSDFTKYRKKTPADAANMTLRDVFNRYYRQRRKQLQPNSVVSCETTLKRWEMVTGNPTIGELADDDFDWESFAKDVEAAIIRTRLDGRPGMLSAPAANKDLRQLQALLYMCGPRGKQNPDGLGFLNYLPMFREFDEAEPQPRIITNEELGALYVGCRHATWPDNHDVSAELWWQASLVYLSNCGSRTSDWLSLKIANCNLQEGWAFIEAERKTKKPHTVVLLPCVVEHLSRIWGEREFVFPAPNNKSYRNKTFRAIQTAAGFSEPFYRIKDLRSTCGDRYYAVNDSAAQFALNHSDQKTTDRHYARPQEHRFRFLQKCAAEIAQPAEFLEAKPKFRVIG